jgi:hypothetical protein
MYLLIIFSSVHYWWLRPEPTIRVTNPLATQINVRFDCKFLTKKNTLAYSSGASMTKKNYNQGILTEEEGSVQLTSSLR